MLSVSQVAEMLRQRADDLGMEQCRLEVVWDRRLLAWDIRLVDIGPVDASPEDLKMVTRQRAVPVGQRGSGWIDAIMLNLNLLLAEGQPFRPLPSPPKEPGA